MRISLIVPFIAAAAVLLMGTPLWGGQAEGDGDKAVPAAEAIYAPDPSHVWNRVHQTFFVRPGARGNLESDAIDPPLWFNTSKFLSHGTTHEAAIGVLDEFLDSDGHDLIADPLKRAILQHDLWAVFDWSALSIPAKASDSPSGQNLAELRSRLASVIQQLALSGEEIATLPDNLANTASAGAFSTAFDSKHSREPFLPADLLDPEGPWVCVRGAFPGPSAPLHAQYFQGRSPFLVFFRLPGGREATRQYITELNEATRQNKGYVRPQFPAGKAVALLRQVTVIDNSGQIQPTSPTQSLQMRVYREVGYGASEHKAQAPFKFRMKRSSLFAAGHGGLEPIGWSRRIH